MDAKRFAEVVAGQAAGAIASADLAEQAFETLVGLAAAKDSLFALEVPAGARLDDVLGAAYAWIGRAFGAARVADGSEDDPSCLEGYPFERWTAGERRLAPPLVVRVRGSDLRAGLLAPFLDGAAKIVLVVDGVCPPAALARLITPDLYVLQTDDIEALEGLASRAGAGIAALVPESAARFVHDPARGSSVFERVDLVHAPSEAPREMVAGLSPSQQAQELAQLEGLAKPPAAAQTTPEPAAPVEDAPPVDKLAAWLLDHADLSDVM